MTSDAEPSDGALMRRAQTGNVDALDRLFERHHERVYAFLARWLGDPEAAHDVVQETFLRVLAKRHQAPPHTLLLPWLIRIARNIAIDRYRHERRLDAWDDMAVVADAGPLPLDSLVAAERDQQLNVALAAVAPAQREVLLLRAVEGMSHRDIASVVGCSEAAARVRVHRATVALRTAWHTRFGDAYD